MTEAKRVTAKPNVSRNVIGLFRQREADRFRARQAFHKTNSVITAAAAETSKTGMRTISACKREAFTAPATAPSPRKSLAEALATRIAHTPSTTLPTRAALESSKEGEDDF
jgi:hypothetical protein